MIELRGIALLFAVLGVAGCTAIAVIGDYGSNKVSSGKPGFEEVKSACGADCAAAADVFIVDLHADPFLWKRDIRRKTKRGHVDVHRLRAGGVDVQVFSVPSSTPFGRQSFAGPERPGDPRFVDPKKRFADFGGLKCTEPPQAEVARSKNTDTTGFLFAFSRGLLNSKRIAYRQARDFCEMSGGDPRPKSGRFTHCEYEERIDLANYEGPLPPPDIFPILNSEDLKALKDFNAGRPLEERAVGGILSIEGVHWIRDSEDLKEEAEQLRRAGFKLIGLTHKYTNSLAGSDEACAKPPGLTDLGVAFARAVLEEGMMIDIAHLSAASVIAEDAEGVSILDLLEEKRAEEDEAHLRAVMSHGGVRLPYCENHRNLPDAHVKTLLERGAPFGVIHWDAAYCVDKKPRETVLRRILDAYEHAIDIAGWEVATSALAIGADLDGAVRAPFDVTGFPYLLTRMEKSDWCQSRGREACREAIAAIAGENAFKVFEAGLPKAPAD